ncbi:hypothetical protein HG535_0F03900 [Zygotorulaspora mrakii]|uniref:Aminotransferase class I/classII large domain-containing protein n=1 Tax=Zygotorulaspora mrakii TaxID=42260 RepID=A0A7H9B7D5_ZYGMR|nr:uncharacterized protein HG535_0F03900 [Zygotorulaspora mrakii]QLG73879.1 hypothetical protein HG535_0F03900 [Zygotorulaspora mrakii]
MTVLQMSKDFSHLYSIQTKTLKPSPLEVFMPLFYDPKIVFLGSGLPMSQYFPWKHIHSVCPRPPFLDGVGAVPSGREADTCTIMIPKDEATPAGDTQDIVLARALQYGFGEGPPEILNFVQKHTEMIHDIKYADWDILLTIGNTAAWDLTLRVFCNRGDSILAEKYSYSPPLCNAEGQGLNIIPVPMDEYGLVPTKLKAILENWNPKKAMPKLLYTIPMGQNPTGVSLPEKRKKEIYEIAQAYDFLIVEDDPYYFFQMDPYVEKPSERSDRSFGSRNDFISSLARSFLSFDTDGRVIRLESCSKTLGPGIRLGWIVGSKGILENMERLSEITVLSPSGISLSIVAGTLNRWGQHGYLDWLIGLRREYTKKRDGALDACREYLPNESWVEIIPPAAGMFFSIIIDASAHPDFRRKFHSKCNDVEQYLYQEFIAEGTLVFPSQFFEVGEKTDFSFQYAVDCKSEPHKIFFRGTYAAVSIEETREGIKRLGRVLKREFYALD